MLREIIILQEACGIAYTYYIECIRGKQLQSAKAEAIKSTAAWNQLIMIGVKSVFLTAPLSWIFGRSGASFSVSWWGSSCRSMYTFSHELGHNMNLFHDRYTLYHSSGRDSGIPLYPYGYGYIDPSESSICERTIMSYDIQCEDEGRSSRLRSLFSNPHKRFQASRNPAGKTGSDLFKLIVNGPCRCRSIYRKCKLQFSPFELLVQNLVKTLYA